MKRLGTFLTLAITLLLLELNPFMINYCTAETPEVRHGNWYALIVCGSDDGSFRNNTAYMYHVLSEHYCFRNITYLSVYTDDQGVDDNATRNTVRSAINNTLANWSNENDTVFIYFSSHGGGFLHHTERVYNNTLYPNRIPGAAETGRYDDNGDEGNEIRESALCAQFYRLNALHDMDSDGNVDDWVSSSLDSSIWIKVDIDNDGSINKWITEHYDIDGDGQDDDMWMDSDRDNCCDVAINAEAPIPTSDGEDEDNDGYIIGVDLNGDGDFNDWVGVDECMQVGDGRYWDDELDTDLDFITCDRLIFVRQGCIEGNETCYGGGLIDDLSAPNRVIMCPTNETWASYGDLDGDGLSEWSEAFIDALHGEEGNVTAGQIIHTGIAVDADLDSNGHVNLWEAWQYAWDHDDARLVGLETPWFDDDGDKLPTFIDGADHLDIDGQGDFMRQICLEPNLATILNKTGFTNRQETTAETFGPGVYEVKLLAEFAGYQEYNNLSWYPTGTTSYNLIFSGSEGRLGYIEPPITKTFKATTQFGLSFHSPEARYFTETNRNPDGIKHAQVYRNLNNPDMYLIGFENVLGGGDKDCNDMVISLEITNKPPNKPQMPYGSTTPLLNITYAYYANTTDPEGGYIQYQFHWGDNSNSTTGWKASGATASATHYWTSEGTYQVRVRAKDTSQLWSEYSNPLTVTVEIGGGGGCPSLHIYNGTTYNSLGIINIHAQDDITKEIFILQEDVFIHNYKAYFKLEEGWEGLNYSHSIIDQVKLYAVINGTRLLCPLIHATHSRLGNVLLKLLLSDDWKTDMYLHETIDLKFFVPYQNVNELTFTIEGHNPYKE